jgi:hypothetical protein
MRGKANHTRWPLCVLFLMAAVHADATGRVIYVDADGAGDGASWAAGCRSLQDALADARPGDEIRVARGIYKPDQGTGQIPGDRAATFRPATGVTIKGGYAGFGEPDPNMRDTGLYETILSGDLKGDDGPSFTGNSENSNHVVTGSGTRATAVLDGFTITGGNANGPSSSKRGGGMNNSAGSPTVTHCTFVGNWAENGGGMGNERESNPILENCIFRANRVEQDGGGIYNNSSSPRLTNCAFTENLAGYGGAGMSNDSSDPVLSKCTFSRNLAHFGGGMFNRSSGPTIANCTFSENSVYDYGGGMYSTSSSPIVTNSLFTGNQAGPYGAGMSFNSGRPVLTNCTFAGNKAPSGKALSFVGRRSTIELTNCILWDGVSQIRNDNVSTITISYSNIAGGWAGTGNIDVDPLFAAVGYWDPNGTASDTRDDFWVGGDYHLQSKFGRWDPISQTWVQDQASSPCIDAGDSLSPIGYEPLPNGGRVNMGAYGGTPQASLSPDDPNVIPVLAQASNPIPADQAVDVSIFPRLNWTADPNTVLHHVYFGIDEQPPFAGSLAQTRFVPAGLTPYTTYHWRVDELDGQARKTIGDIWTLVTGPPPLQAYDPDPVDGATMVSPHPTLSWAAGFNSVSHDVYFGTTDPPPFVRNQAETEFDPGLLDGHTTYFWCIDEISSEGITIGQVWMFVTGASSIPKGRTCFVGDTGVWLDGALVPISKAMRRGQVGRTAGDILSPLPCLGEVETVQEHKGTFACYDVLLESGNSIGVAGNHYFLADCGQWISLHDLKAGMRLKTAKGPLAITAVTKRAAPYAGEVYNLKVNGSHRYLVGQDAIIVRDY